MLTHAVDRFRRLVGGEVVTAAGPDDDDADAQSEHSAPSVVSEATEGSDDANDTGGPAPKRRAIGGTATSADEVQSLAK